MARSRLRKSRAARKLAVISGASRAKASEWVARRGGWRQCRNEVVDIGSEGEEHQPHRPTSSERSPAGRRPTEPRAQPARECPRSDDMGSRNRRAAMPAYPMLMGFGA